MIQEHDVPRNLGNHHNRSQSEFDVKLCNVAIDRTSRTAASSRLHLVVATPVTLIMGQGKRPASRNQRVETWRIVIIQVDSKTAVELIWKRAQEQAA